jgi:hypothetical protein
MIFDYPKVCLHNASSCMNFIACNFCSILLTYVKIICDSIYTVIFCYIQVHSFILIVFWVDTIWFLSLFVLFLAHRKWRSKLKIVEIPTHKYFCSLCQWGFDGMLIMTKRNGPVPLNRRCSTILKTFLRSPLIDHNYIFLLLVLGNMYVVMTYGVPRTSPLNISKSVEIPNPKSQVQACGVSRQWPPLHVTGN